MWEKKKNLHKGILFGHEKGMGCWHMTTWVRPAEWKQAVRMDPQPIYRDRKWTSGCQGWCLGRWGVTANDHGVSVGARQ